MRQKQSGPSVLMDMRKTHAEYKNLGIEKADEFLKIAPEDPFDQLRSFRILQRNGQERKKIEQILISISLKK